MQEGPGTETPEEGGMDQAGEVGQRVVAGTQGDGRFPRCPQIPGGEQQGMWIGLGSWDRLLGAAPI